MPTTRSVLFPTRPWLLPVFVLAMLVAMAVQIAAAVHGESPTWDEGDHLFSGFMSLRTGDFGLNPEHPPLAKMVGALPLVGLDLKLPKLQDRFFKAEAYDDGRKFLFGNAPPQSMTEPLRMSMPAGEGYTAQQLIFHARLAMLVFPLSMALLVFLAAREMFCEAAALVALFLTILEPNLLAHGSYVTTDSAASCCFLGAIYTLYRFCKVPSWQRLLVVGVAGGVALAAKHSTVFLLPMFVVVIAAEIFLRYRARHADLATDTDPDFPTAGKSRASHEQPLKPASPTRKNLFFRDVASLYGSLAAIVLIAILVLWCFYGWRFSIRPAGLAMNPSLAVACSQIRPVEGRILMGLAHAHLLPEAYLYGLADIRNLGNTWPSYLFGHVYAHGVSYYFPVSLLIKSTLPELILLILALAAIALGKLCRPREILFLVVPLVIYLMAAVPSGLNIGMRHILPLYPLAIVLAAGGVVALIRDSRPWQAIVAFLLCFQAFTSLHAFPNYLAYSNEAFGGSANTHKYLTDSSVDWVQQLIAVKAYVQENNVHNCWFAYWAYPAFRPADYGIPCRELPTWDSMSGDEITPVPTTITGPVFLSHGALTGYEYRSAILNPLARFVSLKSIAEIQDGVFVYSGTFFVPELSSMSHLAVSRIALKRDDNATAITEAEAAVSLWPAGFEQREQLGDALHAAHRDLEARQNYQIATNRLTHDMEPSARDFYESELKTKISLAQ